MHSGVSTFGVQGKQRQDRVQQIRDPQPVGSYGSRIATFARKMGIGKHDFVPMPHAAQRGQQFGAN